MILETKQVTIKGLTALLMHRFPSEPIKALEKKSGAEQAEYAAYRIPDGAKGKGELYIPGIAIQRALVAGAAFSKGKGRASLQKQAAACISISPEYVGLGVKDYAIDARPVVVPATRGRVMRYRPRLDEWQVSFEITFDETLIKESELRCIVDDTGSRVGLLEFRPARKGMFGRFMVTEWK